MSESLALDGRALGQRGLRTRARLLEATAELLDSGRARDLRVVDIARAVGTSPATFYQYFRDVESAVLALAEAAAEDLTPITHRLAEPWSSSSARQLVEAFVAAWEQHRAVFRMRNLAAQEGDPRFRAVRNASLLPITEAVAARVAESQRAGRVAPDISPIAAASALVAMTERVASFHREIEELGVARDSLIATTARIIDQTVTGPS
ncbi:MAG TPA: TetR family transcriptional regulator [Acidimicrobiia bacterium]|nr:TetR family transcriptional regulator [Acidimicrobiia bacterium]